MKNIILILIALPFFALGQNSLTYNQTQDPQFFQSVKNNTKFNSYITKSGLTINIGDTLKIGNAILEGKKYMFNDVFTHIAIGKVKGSNKTNERVYLPHTYSGEKVIVKSIAVTHQKNTEYQIWTRKKDMPLYVSVFVTSPKEELSSIKGISSLFSHSRKTILNIEEALSSSEILESNTLLLTREEAIKKLKESKDLMELGLMSKKEYEKLRTQLTPIIMNK